MSTKFALIAQWSESDAYIVKVVGSSPSVGTKFARLAQLIRALAFQAKGRGFESHISLKKTLSFKVHETMKVSLPSILGL